MSQQDLAAVSDSNGDQNPDKTAPMCPACGSKLTRRSMRRSWKDRFKSVFGLWPYRCQMCYMRFTGPQDAESIARYNASTEEQVRARQQEARQQEEEQREREEGTREKSSGATSEEPDKK
jgi:hypothetical protein